MAEPTPAPAYVTAPAGATGVLALMTKMAATSSAADILNLDRYQYFRGGTGWSSNPAEATPIVAGPVSEMSVAYNAFLGRFIMLTERSGTIVMRTSPSPVGPWSGERVLVSHKQSSGLYTPYIHPRSSGRDLYFVVSRWDDYNVMLIRTDLSKVRS